LKAALLSLTALTFIVLISRVMDVTRLDISGKEKHLYLYLLYSVPQTIMFVIPAALIFGVSFTLSSFVINQELTAIYAAGISFYRAAVPVLFAGVLAVLLVFLFMNFVVAGSTRLSLSHYALLKKDTATVQDIVFQKNIKGRYGYYFIYYLDREKQRIVGGFNYLEIKEGKPVRMLSASRAFFENGSWRLEKGSVIFFEEPFQVVRIENFAEKNEELPEGIDFFARPARSPLELNFFELLEEVELRRSAGIQATDYEVQMHINLSFPLMCFIVTLVGALSGSAPHSRGTGPLIRSLLIAMGTMLSYEVLFRLGESMGKNQLLPPFVAGWLPTLIFAGGAVFMVLRVKR